MIPRALLALALAAVPTPAAACAVCLDSAFGNRSFNWAFVGLMLAPFLVAAGLGVTLARLRAPEEAPDGGVEAPSEREEKEGSRC